MSLLSLFVMCVACFVANAQPDGDQEDPFQPLCTKIEDDALLSFTGDGAGSASLLLDDYLNSTPLGEGAADILQGDALDLFAFAGAPPSAAEPVSEVLRTSSFAPISPAPTAIG